MPTDMPFVRDTGSGPSVVCIHASASSSGQWRALTDRLADRFRVIAVDVYGAGKTPAWTADRAMRLDDEVALLTPVFRAAGDRFHLIGHSYGAAIALKAALTHRGRLLSLVLYEPVMFSVLLAQGFDSAPAREILALGNDTVRLVDDGRLDAAAQQFIEYWMGDGAWAATPELRRPVLAAAMGAVKLEWAALFHEPTPLAAFADVDVPTLLMSGSESRTPALAVVRLLAGVLPLVQAERLQGVGHMAPVTHPHTVNARIERFLEIAGSSRELWDEISRGRQMAS
jgi:pimeloyl-ACP methyl ester carboxylesterase